MAGLGRPQNWWATAALAFGFMAAFADPVSAQFGGQFPAQNDLTPEQSLIERLPREPQVLADLNDARELLTAGDHEAAIDVLQSLIEHGEDFFELEMEKPSGSTLGRVESLLRGMPSEAIETYRRRYEPLAAQRLAAARKRGDLTELLEIVRIYPLTLAAMEAAQAAGDIAFDQGETALAARVWERLLRDQSPGAERTALLIEISRAWTLAGQPESAAVFVKELSTLTQTSPIEYDGKLLAPPVNGDATWLNKVFGPVAPLVPQRANAWHMGGGHPRRWGHGPLVSPLQRDSWVYPLIDQYDVFTRKRGDEAEERHAKFETMLRNLETKYLRNAALKTTPLLVGSPLVDGETVLVQGLGSVKALDARTGLLKWSGVVKDDIFLYFAERNYDDSNERLVDFFLAQRTWLNQTGASLASDGHQVYSITGTGMVGVQRPNMFMQNRGQPTRSELTPPSDNRLLAYDIQTGRLKWEAGGPSVAVQAEENAQLVGESKRLAGAFFMGAPLPVDGQLFVLAEHRGQIRLFSLAPETGETAWSLPLLNPDSPIAFDETRRMYGLSPSFAGGLLICPTGEGVVVAIDPLLRRVAWIHQYQPRSAVMNDRVMMMMRFQPRSRNENGLPIDSLLRARRWFDVSPVLTPGRILLPAPESNQLYCLDMESGKPLWSLDRKDGLFIAACTERHCLIAGERNIQAIRLSDGKSAWSQEIPTPTGRGVVSGGKYLLPVSTNEILAFDMRTGRILARSQIDPSKNYNAGSLVAAGDRLLMQTASELVGLRPLSEMNREIASQLDASGTRAMALAEQGELLLIQGREPEAVAILKESLQLQDSAPTRRLLVWSLLDRLKTDRSGSLDLIEELKRTAIDPDQKRLVNRLSAEGLEKSGESLAAFRAYLDIVDDINLSDELMEISINHRARDDRWLRGRLTQLHALANDSLRQQMRQALTEKYAAVPEPPQKLHFAQVVGFDLAPQLHLELAMANRLDQFMGQRVLWTLSESSDPKLRGPAVARLVQNELAQRRTLYIGHLLGALQHELASVECEPGVTGAALLERLQMNPQNSVLLQKIEQRASLPSVTPRQTGLSAILHSRDVFPVLGPKRGPYTDWMMSVEQGPSPQIQITDGSGRNRNTPNHGDPGEMRQNSLRYAQTDPQLVLLAFRDRFMVTSPMDSGNQARLIGVFADPSQANDRAIMNLRMTPGLRNPASPPALGSVGPLTFDTLCYQTGEELLAVMPYSMTATKTPKIQWRRSGTPAGSEILGDSDFVVLVPPQQDRLLVYRTADGAQLAERRMPPGRVDRKRCDWGRLVLVSRTEKADATRPERLTWAMYDPVSDKEVWTQTFPTGTLWAPVNGSDLAFLQPGGTLQLLDHQTGQTLWAAALPAQSVAPAEFTVHIDEERMYVHMWHPMSPGQDPIMEEISSKNGSITLVNGLVVALERRTGQILWSRPMEQQLFHANVPAGSGLLAYIARRQRESAPSVKSSYTTLVLLNRRTGDPVLNQEMLGSRSGDGWTRQPSGAMLLRLSGQDFRLKWEGDTDTGTSAPDQDEPVPPVQPDGPVRPQ